MYSLNCEWYPYAFSTISELIYNIMDNGMDPNYEITRDGVGIGEMAIDHIVF